MGHGRFYIFILLSDLLSPFKVYVILCCNCCFNSYLCYCIYYHFILLYGRLYIFVLLLDLLSPFKVYLILCCNCCFNSYLCYCIYYHFLLLFILRNPLSQKYRVKTISFISSLWTYMKTRFNWSQLLFLEAYDIKTFQPKINEGLKATCELVLFR